MMEGLQTKYAFFFLSLQYLIATEQWENLVWMMLSVIYSLIDFTWQLKLLVHKGITTGNALNIQSSRVSRLATYISQLRQNPPHLIPELLHTDFLFDP